MKETYASLTFKTFVNTGAVLKNTLQAISWCFWWNIEGLERGAGCKEKVKGKGMYIRTKNEMSIVVRSEEAWPHRDSGIELYDYYHLLIISNPFLVFVWSNSNLRWKWENGQMKYDP